MTDESVPKNYKNEGGNTEYLTTYKPGLLTSIPRIEQRSALGITEEALPFGGMDFWNAFEFSWLNNKGKPEVAVAQFQVPCQSTNIIESKSLKFYLGSYSNTKFSNRACLLYTSDAADE